MFVPSLSWQKDIKRFEMKMAQK
eukprot:COSAG06_NODE_34549_length_473_cov_0.687166_1_plen_22_part_10